MSGTCWSVAPSQMIPSLRLVAILFLATGPRRSFQTSAPTLVKRKMPTKLSAEERSSDLAAILKNGWVMDESGRDAIKKKYAFKAQCGNFWIFLLLRFYVKSVLMIVQAQKLECWNF